MSEIPTPGPGGASTGGNLYRSTRDRWIAGVCGGIGEHLGIDPLLVRILWILFSLVYGAGLLVYIICIFLIPEET